MNGRRELSIAVGILAILLIGAYAVFVSRVGAPTQPQPVVETPIATSTPTAPTSTSPTTSAPVRAFGTVTLALGETVRFSGLTITPLDIIEDSRCPIDVQCIQAGTVRVSVRVASGLGTSVETLTLGKQFTTEAETITLTSVSPQPSTTAKYAKSAYRMTFLVEKRTSSTAGKCFVGGCSSEVCSDQPDTVSNCIYREQFACYKNATCERQASGQCGWTKTPALTQCLMQSS